MCGGGKRHHEYVRTGALPLEREEGLYRHATLDKKKKASEPFFDSCPTDDVRSSPSRAWDKPRIVSQQYAVFLEWQTADIKRCAVGYWHHRHAVDCRSSMLDSIRSTLPFAGSECGTCRSFRLFLDQ